MEITKQEKAKEQDRAFTIIFEWILLKIECRMTKYDMVLNGFSVI